LKNKKIIVYFTDQKRTTMEKTSKSKPKQKSKKTKKAPPKVSYHYKPDNLTLEQWQIALRQQAAQKENFAISEMNAKEYPGYYRVANPVSHNEYRVVFRGHESPWNYCSCMDFKTSQLGTCKHLEAVKLWIAEKRKKIHREQPSYTSVYLSYRKERKVCLRIGTDNAEEFRQLAQPYFTPEGEMRPESLNTISEFLHKAFQLNNSFRWYNDAWDFIAEKRDKRNREKFLEEENTDAIFNSLLKTRLFPYQKEGIRFAYRAGKSIIADEMGLGKTIQAIGTAELMRKQGLVSSALILCPTSLKYQWKKEIEKFTDADAIVIEGNHLKRKELYKAEEFYKIVSYNSACKDIQVMRSLTTDLLIMDEVQRLKNWNTQIAKAARHIESAYAVVLSGTPLENKLEELYSVVQFVDQYALGPYYQFVDQTIIKSDTGKTIGYKGLNAVGEQLHDILLRRRKKDVALQLPERMDKILFVPMTEQQQAMHDECQSIVAQLVMKWNRQRFLSEKDQKRLLLLLSQMRMVCDSTYILDQKSRYDTKVDEVMNILNNVFESSDEKVVIFSQWERMTRLIAAELDKLGIRYEYLHGGVPSEKRKVLMENFTELPESRVFISTDAGSTGLNLQVASILINIDLPWNPAILEQRIARIYRIGQQRNIQIINLVAPSSLEERILSTLNFKTSLFEGILDNGEDSIFLEGSKLDKIMENIASSFATPKEKNKEDGTVILTGDQEEIKPKTSAPTDSPNEAEEEKTESESERKATLEEKPQTEEELHEGILEEMGGISDTCVSSEKPAPAQLIQQGVSFLSGLAKTFQSPEATRELVDSLIEEDKETGQTTLRIPVPDKESVTNLLNAIGKLFS